MAEEYVRSRQIQESKVGNLSVQETQIQIQKNLWDIIETEKEITSIKASVEEKYAEVKDLYNKSKSKDIKEASAAIEAILQRNSPDQLDNLAQDAVQIAESRKKQLKAFEEIKELNGGKLDKNLNARYKTLKKTAAKEKAAFTANIQQRLEIQLASDLAKTMQTEGLIAPDVGQNNAVKVLRTMGEDQNIKVALAKGASEVASSTFGNPDAKNACSVAFKEVGERVYSIVDKEKLRKIANAVNEESMLEKEKEKEVSHVSSSKESSPPVMVAEVSKGNQTIQYVSTLETGTSKAVDSSQSGNKRISEGAKTPLSDRVSFLQQEIEALKQEKKAQQAAPEIIQSTSSAVLPNPVIVATKASSNRAAIPEMASQGQSGDQKSEVAKTPLSDRVSFLQQEIEALKQEKKAQQAAPEITQSTSSAVLSNPVIVAAKASSNRAAVPEMASQGESGDQKSEVAKTPLSKITNFLLQGIEGLKLVEKQAEKGKNEDITPPKQVSRNEVKPLRQQEVDKPGFLKGVIDWSKGIVDRSKNALDTLFSRETTDHSNQPSERDNSQLKESTILQNPVKAKNIIISDEILRGFTGKTTVKSILDNEDNTIVKHKNESLKDKIGPKRNSSTKGQVPSI